MKNENATPTMKHDGQLSIPHGGLTLRDYFAAKAMQASLSRGTPVNIEAMAKAAYTYADTMLSERNK